jgi:hypothetical protein
MQRERVLISELQQSPLYQQAERITKQQPLAFKVPDDTL